MALVKQALFCASLLSQQLFCFKMKNGRVVSVVCILTILPIDILIVPMP